MLHYHIHVRRGLSELIILISIDNVPTLYQNKHSKNNSLNYLPAQFRYLQSGVYWCESNVNIFWITLKAFNLWVFLCLISPAEFCGFASMDTWHFSKAHDHLIDNRWVTWLRDCGQLNLSHTLLKLVAIVLVKLEIKHFSECHVIT